MLLLLVSCSGMYHNVFILSLQRSAVPAYQGPAPDAGRDAQVPARPRRHGHRHAARQGGAEVVRQREALLLPPSVHVPLRRRLAAEEGRDAQSGRDWTGISTVRVHRDRKLGSGPAAAGSQWKGTSKKSLPSVSSNSYVQFAICIL